MRYSNIEPDHEMRAEPRPTGVSARPSRNQWSAGDVALGDREEARQTGLRGEEVVVARVQRAVADPEADREELARGVEQEREVGLAEQRLGLVGDRPEAPDERGGPGAARRPRLRSASSARVGKPSPPAAGWSRRPGPGCGCSRPGGSPPPRSRARRRRPPRARRSGPPPRPRASGRASRARPGGRPTPPASRGGSAAGVRRLRAPRRGAAGRASGCAGRRRSRRRLRGSGPSRRRCRPGRPPRGAAGRSSGGRRSPG